MKGVIIYEAAKEPDVRRKTTLVSKCLYVLPVLLLLLLELLLLLLLAHLGKNELRASARTAPQPNENLTRRARREHQRRLQPVTQTA